MRFSLLDLGFRTFFLLAGLFAVISIALWGLFYFGHIPHPSSTLNSFHWHAHEMIYGYSMAVIAGFLLTAVRNWTGIQTLAGSKLALLAGAWLSARVGLFLDWLLAAFVFDVAFMALLLYGLLSPIVKAKNWKQLLIISMIALLLLFDIVFYLGGLGFVHRGEYIGIYGGLYLIIGLILLMSRRLIPFFVEGARYAANPDQPMLKLRNSELLDRLILFAFAAFFVSELSAISPSLSAYLASLLFICSSVRLCYWYHPIIWKTPLLWVLQLALWSITLGFLLFFLSMYLPISKFIAVHAMAYGGIGLVSIGMMARVSLGHTGRNVYAPPKSLTLMFLLLVLGAVIRVVLPMVEPEFYRYWIGLSQCCWVGAYGLFVWVYTPMLWQPRLDGKVG